MSLHKVLKFTGVNSNRSPVVMLDAAISTRGLRCVAQNANVAPLYKRSSRSSAKMSERPKRGDVSLHQLIGENKIRFVSSSCKLANKNSLFERGESLFAI